ncbi:MAG TPA: glycosyltransferase family 9 protein [Vicinamibacterales bacterium]|nr:glycosyltransferase family 9 protein [Vicinamibacterales bacterium]
MTILLVRPRLIGDVLLTTPLVRALRRRYPEATLLYLVEAMAAPIVRANPHVSETIVITHRRGWRRIAEDWSIARRLRARRIDVALDLHGGPRSSWLTFASRAKMRVGYDVSGRGWMYTHLVPRPRGYAPRHSVLNQWDLLAPVDSAFLSPPDPDRDRLEMPVEDAARGAIRARLTSHGVRDADAVIVMHVGAGNDFRRWPAASFAEVAAALAREGRGRALVVVGAAGDTPTIREVASHAGRAAGEDVRVVEAVDWPLTELRALMDRASLFVGGDSGPMHIAAAADVPIVALFGPTLPVHWAPWRPARLPFVAIEPGPLGCRPCDQRVCEPGDFRCLRSTVPGRVIEAATRVLEKAS